MKKLLIEILLGLTVPAAVFHTQIANLFKPEQPVAKTINLEIARDTNYNQSVYDMSKASIHVVIFKVRDNKQIVLWEKDYDTMLLKNYPTIQHALKNDVTVGNILDRKERLYVTYTVTYNTNGGIMHLVDGTCLLKGEKQGKVVINI